MTGRMPQEGINPVELPVEVAHVWGWFLHLNAKRQPAISGVAPISELEISLFLANRGISLEGWELDAIEALDRVARDSVGAH